MQPRAGDTGPLEADSELAIIEAEWRYVFMAGDDPDGDEVYPWTDTEWLDWLAERPLAWHSFAILEDLLMSIDCVLFDDDELECQVDAMEEALLDRALALLRLNLGKNEAWYYRQSWRGVWERSGALDWLILVIGGKA